MKAVLSIWVSVSLFNMLAALSVGGSGSGRDSPAPTAYRVLAWLSTGPVKASWWALLPQPCAALLRNLHQASGRRPRPPAPWSVVQWPMTEPPAHGRSQAFLSPMVRGRVTPCRWSSVTGSRRVAPVMWWPDTTWLSPAHGHLSGDRPVMAQGLSPRYVCAHTSIGSLGPFCQVTDLSSAMRDPPFAGRVAEIGLNHCFCHNHNKFKRSIVRVLLTKGPLGSPTPPEISVVICRNEAPLLL